jgi:hypothetical protein
LHQLLLERQLDQLLLERPSRQLHLLYQYFQLRLLRQLFQFQLHLLHLLGQYFQLRQLELRQGLWDLLAQAPLSLHLLGQLLLEVLARLIQQLQ